MAGAYRSCLRCIVDYVIGKLFVAEWFCRWALGPCGLRGERICNLPSESDMNLT